VARILPDGKVTPCIYLPTAIGSLRERTFSEIWQRSELLRDLRRRDRNYTGNCKDCEHIYNCGGCRAAAYAYGNKDLFNSDPYCWINSSDGKMSREAADKAKRDSVFNLKKQ
jgi:radical SAM protein with 4Fe4S-binding SPASM domain